MIEASGDLPVLVGRTKPGKTVKIEILRDGKIKVVSLIVGDLKLAKGDVAGVENEGPSSSKVVLGLSVSELTDVQKREAGVEHGVLVRDLDEGPASDAGIRPGDVIASINKREINSVAEFRSAVKALKPGTTVPVFVLRKGSGAFLVLRVPQ